jgi:hypothetical protein
MSKYGAKRVEVDGIVFDSKLESQYYLHLKELKAAGVVKHFELQPEFILMEKFYKRGILFRQIKYKADFHVWYTDGEEHIVDVKGMETADFKIKRKLYEKQFPLELKLIAFSKMDGGWIELDELKKRRKERKKLKEQKK